MEEERRELEPELTLQPVPDPTREHAHPRAQDPARAHDLHAVGVRAEALHPESRPDLDAGALSGGAELAVELPAIDDGDALTVGGEGKDAAGRASGSGRPSDD